MNKSKFISAIPGAIIYSFYESSTKKIYIDMLHAFFINLNTNTITVKKSYSPNTLIEHINSSLYELHDSKKETLVLEVSEQTSYLCSQGLHICLQHPVVNGGISALLVQNSKAP